MKKKTKQIISISIVVVAVIAIGLYAFLQQSFYSSGYLVVEGINCNSQWQCSGSYLTETYARLPAQFTLYVDSDTNHALWQNLSSNPYFINKTCSVEWNSELGFLQMYGRTMRSNKPSSSYPILCDVSDYVIVNNTALLSPDVLNTYTQNGERRINFGALEAKWDFTTSEYPVLTAPQPTPSPTPTPTPQPTPSPTPAPQPTPQEQTFLQKYQNTLIVGAILLALIIITFIVLRIAQKSK